MEPDELIGLHSIYHEAIENAEKDPYHYGFRLPHWSKAEEQLFEVNEILALGGNRCLGAEQEIYDPVADCYKRVDEIKGHFHVNAWDGRQMVVARAEKPFRKPVAGIYQVSLDNGQVLFCSKAHLLLTPFGWRSLGSLDVGGALVSAQPSYSQPQQQSILEHNPLRFLLSARRYWQKAQDFLVRCFAYCRQCGEQPLQPIGSGQFFVPSQVGAQAYTSLSCNTCHCSLLHVFYSFQQPLDDLGNKSQCNQTCLCGDHLATLDALHRHEAQFSGTLSHVCGRPYKSPLQLFLSRIQKTLGFALSNLGFYLLGCKCVSILRGIVCLQACGDNSTGQDYVKILSVDYLRDDVVWDFHVPIYNNYIASGVISHNSGKTQWGAFSVVRAAIENPKSEIFCFAQTSEVSIRQQQSAVWDWLPENLKTKQTSANTYISYKKKTGFTDSSLILPNGSQIIFKTYSQYQNNPTILEGAELGSKNPVWHNVGVWADEYLLGPELINTLRFRLATRNAKMLVTFTPIDGWTEVIKEYLDGATTIESRPAELLNGELVPYVQRSKKLNASVHYFHSQDNAFGGYERIKETLSGRTREEILIRAYGVPMKSHATKFPKFNKVINVVSPDKIPTKNITRYHVIDPAGAKNWFMCWIAIDETGTFWVYREWPGVDVGDWAEWKSGKWMPGPGSKGQGFGIRDYIEAIQEMEGEEEIFERLIDPRLGAAKYQVQDGSSSIIEDLSESGMVCIPAPGLDIDDGLQALIGKMSWDTSKPLDSVNRPKFYVSSDCENIIQALSEYTGEGGLKEAWKDAIDVLRYAAIANLDHVDNSQSFVTTHGSGGY